MCAAPFQRWGSELMKRRKLSQQYSWLTGHSVVSCFTFCHLVFSTIWIKPFLSDGGVQPLHWGHGFKTFQFYFLNFVYSFYTYRYFFCMYICACVPRTFGGLKRKLDPSRLVVIGNYELSCGCCELNPGLSKKIVISASKHEAIFSALVFKTF